MTATHTGGSQSLGLMSILIGDQISSNEVCQIILLPPNGINLISDTGVLAGPNLTPGTAGILENSRCSILSLNASVTNSSTERTFSIPVVFSPLMAGLRNVYAVAFDTSGFLTHWVQGAQFNVTF
jgi:hypothetical protein